MTERNGLTVTASSIKRWVREQQALCTYARLRDAGRALYTPHQIIRSVKLYHQQVYEFSIHRAKLDLLAGGDRSPSHFAPVRDYLSRMLRCCPHELFQTTQRASQARAKTHFDLHQVSIVEKQNFATRIAHLSLPTAPSNNLRHETLQRFMLANDSVTVATEVPIYLMPEDVEHRQKRLGFELPVQLTEPLTGHIDFLQIRNGAVHILDYKPDAKKDKPIVQLTFYALALSRATGLRLFDFKCAWFDQDHYYEFFPLHIVHKLK